MMQEQKQIGIKSLYFAMRFNTKMWCNNIINKLVYTIDCHENVSTLVMMLIKMFTGK